MNTNPLETFKALAPNLSMVDLVEAKRQVNRQLAYGKISETFGYDPITAFKVAEVLQTEYFKRMGD